MKNAEITAVGYIRVSTLTQLNEGDGLGVQRDKINAWCLYQNLPLPIIKEDAGMSGSSMEDRINLMQALSLVIKSAPNSILVVYKLDRLGRNALDVQEVLSVLLEKKVRIVSILDSIDSESSMGTTILKLLTGILTTFAELEKENIRVRLLDGRKRADLMNKVYAVEPRYGRKVQEGKILVENEEEQLAINKINEMRKLGLSYRAICDYLINNNIKPRRANKWSTSVIHRIANGSKSRKTKNKTSERTSRVIMEIENKVNKE